MLQRRRLVAAQRRDHAREDDRQPVPAGVHDTRFAQDRQQLGTALDRALARVQGVLEDVGEHLVLGRVVDAMLEAWLAHVRDLARRAGGHLAHDREDRALGGVADAAVRAVGRAGHGGGDEDGVHELARAADELLGGAADELAEDDAGVSARAEQRRAGDGVDDLVAADLVDVPLRGEVVELGQHGAQRQRHVVARVAVGDRKHVQVIDLAPVTLQLGERTLDDTPEAEQARIGHRGGRYALVTLPAFRQRVQT